MPPIPYVTAMELADFMESPLDDTHAEFAIEAACSIVGSYVNQEITRHDDDVVILDGTNLPALQLPQRPVRGVSLVRIDGQELVADTDYRLRGHTLYRYSSGFPLAWPFGLLNVEVTYDHGWDADSYDYAGPLPVPADIRLVTLSIARRAYENHGPTSVAVKSENIGNYAYVLGEALRDAALLSTESAVLEKYVVGGVA